MRRIIYSELGTVYSHLVDVQPTMVSDDEDPTPLDVEFKKFEFRLRFLNYEGKPEHTEKFEGEKYAEDNKDVFIQLRERSTITLLYRAMRDVLRPEQEYGFLTNSGLAIEIMEDCVRLNDLPNKFAKRYMNGPDIAAINVSNKRRLALGQAHPKIG
jgi:hypothetical protein